MSERYPINDPIDEKALNIQIAGSYKFSISKKPMYSSLLVLGRSIWHSYTQNVTQPSKFLCIVIYCSKAAISLIDPLIIMSNSVLLTAWILPLIFLQIGLSMLMLGYFVAMVYGYKHRRFQKKIEHTCMIVTVQIMQLLSMVFLIALISSINSSKINNSAMLYVVMMVGLMGIYAVSDFTLLFIMTLIGICFVMALIGKMLKLLMRAVCRTCQDKGYKVTVHSILYNSYMIQRECIICLVSFTIGEAICRMSCCCNNYYHKNCIVSWWKKKKICPFCRSPATIL